MQDTPSSLEPLAQLVRTHRYALAAIARSEGVSAEDAVDCVQEALCTMLDDQRKSVRPDDPSEWGAVLSGIVRNVARNRRRRHDRSRPHDEIEEHPIDAGIPATDDMIAKAEDHVRLRACVADLCEIQRAVVTLRMLEEHAGEDVAHALGISPGHVAVLLHRAKVSLRACMTGEK